MEKNASLQKNVDAMTKAQASLAKLIAKKNEDVAYLLKIKSDARGALLACKLNVVVKQDTVPPVLAWAGSPTSRKSRRTWSRRLRAKSWMPRA